MADCSGLCAHLCAILCCEKCCPCCVSQEVPYLQSHLDLQFLNKILHNSKVLGNDAKVTGLSAKAFGLGDGMLSQMYRLTLEYSPANAGPKTMVAKVSPENIKMRILGSILDLFKYEDEFYGRDVGPKLGLTVPRCYFTGLGDYGRYCLILDDFAPAKSEDQIAGLKPELIEVALRQISMLHAKYRGKVTTSADTSEWVLRNDDAKYYGLISSEFVKKFKGAEQYYPKLGLTAAQAKPAHMLGQFMSDNADFITKLNTKFFKRCNSSAFPSTLIHGDFRAENILFPQKTLPKFTVFDFQLVKEFNGMVDVCYLMFSSMQIDVRRKHERQLLTAYYNEMHKLGATDLTWVEVCVIYCLGITMCSTITFMGLKDLFTGPNKDDPKTKAFQKQYVTSLAALAKDWQVLKVLDEFKAHSAADGTFTPISAAEYRAMVPQSYHDLLDGSGDSNATAAVEPTKQASSAMATSPIAAAAPSPEPPSAMAIPASVGAAQELDM